MLRLLHEFGDVGESVEQAPSAETRKICQLLHIGLISTFRKHDE